MAAETSAERALTREEEARERAERIAAMSSVEVSESVVRAESKGSASYLGPLSTPVEWKASLAAARDVVIERAKRGETLTYGEIKVAAYEATGHLIGYSMYGRFCEELNRPGTDGCVLSSIIVDSETGEPGPGLVPYAKEMGFPDSVKLLQRQVFEVYRGGSAN
jgi:hypothetical protein